MELHNIFKHLFRWNDTEYTILLSDIERYCENLGYHISNLHEDITQLLRVMKYECEIEDFAFKARKLVVIK